MLMRKLVPYFVPCWHDYYTAKVFIKIVRVKSDNQHVNKLTDIDFKNYTALTLLNPTNYASIMFETYYAQKYAGIIGLGLLITHI